MSQPNDREFPRLTTPRAAAIAGVLFAILFSTSLALLRMAIPDRVTASVDWLRQGAGEITAALIIMPFAAIAFLWFIGVVRDHLGDAEDKFFATVFFGSGLLFLSTVFVAMSIAGGILDVSRTLDSSDLVPASQVEVVTFGRAVMLQISNVYALRMAGVFMISIATLGLRTRIMPRWLALATYLLAIILLIVISLSIWVTFIFPAWVLVISLLILVQNLRATNETASL